MGFLPVAPVSLHCSSYVQMDHNLNSRDVPPSFISFWIPLASGRLLIFLLWHLFLSAYGNLCGWRGQVDPSRSCSGIALAVQFLVCALVEYLTYLIFYPMSALHQIEWAGEKPQIEWPSWCIGLQSSCYICQECEQSCGAEQVTGGV